MPLTKHEEVAIDLAEDFVKFLLANINKDHTVALDISVMTSATLVENFDIEQEDLELIITNIAGCVIHMMQSIGYQQFEAEPRSFKLILAGHFHKVLRHAPIREYANG